MVHHRLIMVSDYEMSRLPHHQDPVCFCQKVSQICPHQRKTENSNIHCRITKRNLGKWTELPISLLAALQIKALLLWQLTLAMSQAVARSQTGAKSKECTLFLTLRAILQSPQPKSATTKEAGLKERKRTFLEI